MQRFLLHKSGINRRGQGELNSLSTGLTDYSLTRKMLSHWVIWLLALSGVAYVSGSDCDPDTAKECYNDLVIYETIAFPLYGNDMAKLDDTCGIINASFDCLEQFMYYCKEEPTDCNEECQDMLLTARHFTKNSGLRDLANDLCQPKNALRKTYLENAKCLYEIADLFASCHNDSQKSQHYIASPSASLEEKCCFFKWHDDCFTNFTRDHCGEKAIFFVSFATHKLIGNIKEQLCFGVDVECTRPPMPPDYDNVTDNDIDYSTESLDDKKEVQIDNDVDNEISNDSHKKKDDTSIAATIKSYTTNWILLPFLYIVLSKYIL